MKWASAPERSGSAAVLAAFETAVRRLQGMVSCHLMAGQYDYMVVVRVASTRIETSFALRGVIEEKS